MGARSHEPRTVRVGVGTTAVVDASTTPVPDGDVLAALLAGARAVGRAEGRAEAQAAARTDAAGRLADAAEQLVARAEALTADAASTALELGLVVARALVLRQVALGEHDVEGIVRAALAEAGQGRGPCVVHLNPADAAALASVDFRAGTRVEADPGVRAGDVHVETPMGLMVRELDECLRDVGARLREELR